MKVVVPVKQVAALDDEFELPSDGADVDPADLEWELNEWDAFSLQAALDLRDGAAGDGEVVAITVGDEDADEAVLNALARGADRAIRIWDDGLRDADALAVARVLAAAVDREQPDLVLCGVQSSDAVNSATGVALAGFLGLAHVAVVKGIVHDGGRLTVERELEGGLVEQLAVALPALLTIQTGINEPGYATLRQIKQARDKPLAVTSLADLGLDVEAVAAAAGSRRRGLAMPAQGQQAEILDGPPADVAARILEIVGEQVS